MFYLNGEFVREEDAKISVLDLSVLRGFAVFDYLRTYRKKPFHLWEHLLRLAHSCEEVGLEIPKSLDEIAGIVEELLARSDFDEASLKIVVTGGISPDQFTPQVEGSNLIAFAYPLSHYPEEYYREGISVITTRLSRSMPASKTTQYTSAIVAIQKAKALKPKEALYVNAQGEILEATTSNFFAFKEGVLYTCDSDEVLVGITREVVLRVTEGLYRVERRPLKVEEISAMEEAFITASNKEVIPVVQIDGQPIGDGKVGPRTREIMRLFHCYTQEEEWPPLFISRYPDKIQRVTHK
ncbi:MAG: aminotransferase class IV [Chlamydiota bacterium]